MWRIPMRMMGDEEKWQTFLTIIARLFEAVTF